MVSAMFKASWLTVWYLRLHLFVPTAHSIRCLSCLSNGLSGVTCENTTSYLDCDDAFPPTGNNDSYRTCYTLTKITDYPIFGPRTNVEKNCTIITSCALFQEIKCYEKHNLTVSCSVDCCSGDFCNMNASSSGLRGSNSSTVTMATAIKSSASSSWQPSVTTMVTTTGLPTRQIPAIACSGSSFSGITDLLFVFAGLLVCSQIVP